MLPLYSGDAKIMEQDTVGKGKLVAAGMADVQIFVLTFIVSSSQNQVCIFGGRLVSCHADINGKLPFVLNSFVVWESVDFSRPCCFQLAVTL
jgi:hypothetical protein